MLGAIGKAVVSLGNAMARHPEQGQKLFGWPDWKTQRISLMSGFPISILFLVIGFSSLGGPIATAVFWLGLGSTMLAGTMYVGISTKWLRDTKQATLLIKIVCGICLVLNAVGLVGVVLFAIFWIIVAILVMIAIAIAAIIAMAIAAASPGTSTCSYCGARYSRYHSC